MLPLPDSPAPRHRQSTTHQKYLICPLPTFSVEGWLSVIPHVDRFLFAKSDELLILQWHTPGLFRGLSAGTREGQTKSQGGSWRAGHASGNLGMGAVWWLAMPLVGHSPGFRRWRLALQFQWRRKGQQLVPHRSPASSVIASPQQPLAM